MSANCTPADEVANTLADFISHHVENALGLGSSQLDGLAFDDAQPYDDAPFPWLLTDAEGRRYEVEWDVTVTELTPELVARRAVEAAEDERRHRFVLAMDAAIFRQVEADRAARGDAS